KKQKKEETDPDKKRVADARAAWPEYTGSLTETVDLSGYSTITLVPFENLTDNSEEELAGQGFIDEVEEFLIERYDDTFTSVRVSDDPLGTTGEVVLRGQVYDYSNSKYNYFTGRTKAKFKAEMTLTDGQTGAVLKSSKISEDSRYESRDEQLEKAAEDVAKMLVRSKKN
ncbi:MAG: hypothetical protein AAFX76_06475, partial [Planctomycetota bacterium]